VAITPAQLEARILELVDTVVRGHRIEDDLVECKREWPPISKARQLAGSANSAHGDPILWIVGLDEDAQQIATVDQQDPAQWWSQMQARFDQGIAPTLTAHLRVPVGNNESVIALLFETDRAPYLVKCTGGSPEREVAVRDGTRTRSAHRDELIRMMTPALRVPQVIILGADLNAVWHEANVSENKQLLRAENIQLSGEAWVYIEHIGTDVMVLPGHEISADFSFAEQTIPLKPQVYDSRKSAAPRWGVYAENGDIICTAPGRFRLLIFTMAPVGLRSILPNIEEAKLSITLGIAGASRPARVSAKMTSPSKPNKGATLTLPGTERLGTWSARQ